MPVALYFLIPVLCCASWSDWKERRIPNSLLLPAFALAILLNLVTRGLDGLLFSLGGTLLGFSLLLIPFLLGGIGAGDVKLLMVIGSFGGIKLVLSGFLIGAILGGIVALSLLLYRKISGLKIDLFPYGIPLVLGTLGSIFLEYLR
jgi:prepilin peptidase CpaA